MRPGQWSFVVFSVLTVVASSVLVRRHVRAAELRTEIARRQVGAQELARLQEENRRLTAAQPTGQELAELAEKLVLADQLRSQLAVMHRRGEASSTAKPQTAVLSLKGNSIAADLWQNSGRMTPDAALETVLWAAANGDIDTLAEVLAFDPETRRQATDTFDRLPAVLQHELGTPERMIALLTAVDVPLGRASILGQYPGPAGTQLAVQLIDANGRVRTSVFSLQTEADQWRLKVPAGVVDRYAGWLGLTPEFTMGRP